MATVLNHVFRCFIQQSPKLPKLLRNAKCSYFYRQGARSLFCAEILGLDSFNRSQLLARERLMSDRGNFIMRMEEYLNSDPHKTVFTEDLKTMLHIAETDEDISLIEIMLKRYRRQNVDTGIGQFKFGPIVMRLLHYKKKTDLACRLMTDQELKGIFDQVSSYTVLMDMMYEDGQYMQILEMLEHLHESSIQTRILPNPITLACAALYRMNTSEAMEKTMDLVKNVIESNGILSNRSIAFIAMLALKNNNPAMAFETLSIKDDYTPNYLTNIKMMALAELGRFEDVFVLLQQAMQQNSSLQPISSIFPETLSKIEELVQTKDDGDFARQFSATKKSLISGNLISRISIEDFLSNTIFKKKFEGDSFKFRPRSTRQNNY